MHEAVQDDKGHGSLFGGVGMKGVVNFGESVRARLLAIAKQENVEYWGGTLWDETIAQIGK